MCAWKSDFQYNLEHSEARIATRPKEALYVKRYLPFLTTHIKQIADANPGITSEQMKEKLFTEIDDYSKTVYENAYIFACYMEYIACQYFQNHKDKYMEISEKIKKSDEDFGKKNYQDCSTFEEYLTLYVYRLKRDLFDMVFDGYLESSPEKYKNFDELLKKHLAGASKKFFGKNFELPEISTVLADSSLDNAKKMAKIKEYSNLYRNPLSKVKLLRFAKLFMNGSFSFLVDDEQNNELNIRKDLAVSTSKIVEQLDSLGHLDNYLSAFTVQMCHMGFPEYATPLCKNGMPSAKIVESFKHLPFFMAQDKAKEFIDIPRLKKMLSEGFLSSSKIVSLESLLALNSFWSNRYTKELDLYSESMFAVHEFGLIDKVLAGEYIDIPEEDIETMLVKMNIFYRPATFFLENMQEIIDHTDSEEPEESTGDVEEKIVRYSYETFYSDVKNLFGTEYHDYFSKLLPNSNNDVLDDASWYIRLYNPIHSAYDMKNESINALISSIDNSKTSNFPNAGIILDDVSSDGTFANLPHNLLVGIDAKLSYPIRIHCRKDVLVDFLKSINGTAIMPVYEGANDFTDPDTGKPLTAHLVVPLDEKYKKIIKNSSNNSESYENPKFVSHLGFLDTKHPPKHLSNVWVKPNGKKVVQFITRYVDLETGVLYTKEEGTFLKVLSSRNLEGEKSHGIE